MKAAFLFVLLCLAEADDIRWEVKAMFKQMNSSLEERLSSLEERLKSCLGGQDAEMATKLTASQKQIELLHTRLNTTEDTVKKLETESKVMAAKLTANQKQVELLQTRLNTTENLETESEVLLLNLDCEGIATHSGVYTINPTAAPVKVYCDMDTDGGNWTVIQRRVDGTVNFYRTWAQYKTGFGDPSGEYWLGLENMHLLTKDKKYQLWVDIEDFLGSTASASYSSFSVGSEAAGYKLQVAGFTDGGAGDSLTYHNGSKFSTFDKDQDNNGGNCASVYYGAFWYNDCHYVNINGVYLWGQTAHYGTSVVWRHWKGYHYSLKAVAMKIRRAP